MNQGPPPHIGQFAQRRFSGSRSQHQLLGDVLAALVVAAIWQHGANLVKHDVHVGLGPFVEVVHGSSSKPCELTPNGASRTELKQLPESKPGTLGRRRSERTGAVKLGRM